MTYANLIYFIGCGVAMIMCIIGFIVDSIEHNREYNFGLIVLTSMFCCLLSWAIPIWWLGYTFLYNKRK